MNMKKGPILHRRGFLQLTGAGVMTVAFAGILTGCEPPPPWLYIQDLGNQYIAKVPSEGSQAILGPQLGNPGSNTQPNTLESRLSTQINTDYANGQIVPMSGLYLSQTDCEIAAFWAVRPMTQPGSTPATAGGTTPGTAAGS